MKLNPTRPLLLTTMLAASFAVGPHIALAAPTAPSTGPLVIYQTQTAPSQVQLLAGDTLNWVDVPGLSATVALSKAAAVVVSYNVTIQNAGIGEAYVCPVFLRAVIANANYTQSVVSVPPATTTSGAQTVANPSIVGSVTVKIQAAVSAAPGSCASVSVQSTPYGVGGTDNTWGSTMTVMVLR